MAWGCDRALGIPEDVRPPGWVDLGREFSLVEDVEYPKDRDVTRAIREFWPKMIPMMCRWVFLSPADEGGNRYVKIFRYHAIGEHMERVEPHQIPLEVPPDYTGDVPNRLVWVFDEGEEPGPQQMYGAVDLPGPFEPWDWRLYWKVRTGFVGDRSARDINEQRQKKRDIDQDAIARQRADLEHALDDFGKWAQRKLETASVEEIRQQLLKSRMAQRKHNPIQTLGAVRY